ncbi:TPA: histidine phosphatase family protein [Citrobacter rodentium]|nr:histidine phosphatase family protein [Citrobacter rodentium]
MYIVRQRYSPLSLEFIVLAFSRSLARFRKYIVILAASLITLTGVSCQVAWSSNGLPRIDIRTLAALSARHPVIVLFRHAERCDRSDGPCLADKTGITEYGAHEARKRGEMFGMQIKNYALYASPAVRTIQSATWFSAGKKLTVDNAMRDCGRGTKSAISRLVAKALGENVVVFTHNHCLTWLAKNMRGVKYDPGYLDALVMHADQDKLYLDGQLVTHY